MLPIKLFIAASLDGFIARPDGGLDWLESLSNPNQIDHGYADFLASVDTLVMGRSTYEEVLGFGVPWPYTGQHTFVLTSQAGYSVKTERTSVLPDLSPESLNMLQTTSKTGIWLVGGGQVVTAFLNEGLVDELFLCLIPVVLGKGIPLFPGQPKETYFDLLRAEAFETGAVMLTYQAQRKPYS
ncbi:MAG: dihydrofolate reductase [Bacteroidetes bacterium]|nr:MAG: dihydrofolate reductase [Bacteroidota bacterium]